MAQRNALFQVDPRQCFYLGAQKVDTLVDIVHGDIKIVDMAVEHEDRTLGRPSLFDFHSCGNGSLLNGALFRFQRIFKRFKVTQLRHRTDHYRFSLYEIELLLLFGGQVEQFGFLFERIDRLNEERPGKVHPFTQDLLTEGLADTLVFHHAYQFVRYNRQHAVRGRVDLIASEEVNRRHQLVADCLPAQSTLFNLQHIQPVFGPFLESVE